MFFRVEHIEFESSRGVCSIENFRVRVEQRGLLDRTRKFRVSNRKALFDARLELDSTRLESHLWACLHCLEASTGLDVLHQIPMQRRRPLFLDSSPLL